MNGRTLALAAVVLAAVAWPGSGLVRATALALGGAARYARGRAQ